MAIRGSEVVRLSKPDGLAFDAVRRDYKLEIATPRPGETVFTALGKYAIHQPDGEHWQLLPAAQWVDEYSQTDQSSEQWATADELRTWAGEGAFLPIHMDALDATLFRDQKVTSEANKVVVASEAELEALLYDHAISVDNWPAAKMRRLYNDVKLSDHPEVENISLHDINGSLWLATAQTMINVYHNDGNGNSYKLQETDVIYFDDHGNPEPPIKSKVRSSMGETGHRINGEPERPYVTARRGLQEELRIEDDDDIARIVSIGSLLRLKEAGHHSFGPIKAEDRTHYFRVDLNPRAVRPEYLNEEYDADGNVRAHIKLEWFLQNT
ncbi:MAG TPA: hypothetical protein VFT59_01255 [Candidatus Saccharimonadales bacterium]|nr:hypothetical protein [Candidatus Saccharimonadales bacterium]